jgi:hypothetical protein
MNSRGHELIAQHMRRSRVLHGKADRDIGQLRNLISSHIYQYKTAGLSGREIAKVIHPLGVQLSELIQRSGAGDHTTVFPDIAAHISAPMPGQPERFVQSKKGGR